MHIKLKTVTIFYRVSEDINVVLTCTYTNEIYAHQMKNSHQFFILRVSEDINVVLTCSL